MSRDPNNILQIPAPTDGSLKAFVKELFRREIISSAAITIAGVGTTDLEGLAPSDDDEGATELEADTSAREWEQVEADIDRAFEPTTSLSISVKRIAFNQGGADLCEFERCKTTVQVLQHGNRIITQHQSAPDTQIAEFNFLRGNVSGGAFNEVLNQVLRPAPAITSGEPAATNIEGVLSNIASVSASLMDELGKAQVRQTERMDELLAKQAEDFEIQQAKLNETHNARLAELEQRSVELDEREEKLDNATTRSTRRGLRKDITADIKDNLKREIIPDSAQRLRWPIYAITLVGIASSLLFSFVAFSQIGNMPDAIQGSAATWYLVSLLVRGSLGVLAATAIGLYVIKYLRTLESEAGRRALTLEQNLFDIDRASWVIETVMELKEEEGMSSVPGPWLEGATRGLFDRGATEVQSRGPVDALVDLMGTGMSVKVTDGKLEASLDSKAAKNAAKKQSTAEPS